MNKVINKMCNLENELNVFTNHVMLWIEKAKLDSKILNELSKQHEINIWHMK